MQMTLEETATAVCSIDIAMPGAIHAPSGINRCSQWAVVDHFPSSDVEMFMGRQLVATTEVSGFSRKV
ncbi:hypothetical protein A5906_07670 [Bradyrhizobium sacchari]|nr:hypothetical protein A5906_07670 [Bradyrhizobium sacchari]